jgi:hypothetical protein
MQPEVADRGLEDGHANPATPALMCATLLDVRLVRIRAKPDEASMPCLARGRIPRSGGPVAGVEHDLYRHQEGPGFRGLRKCPRGDLNGSQAHLQPRALLVSVAFVNPGFEISRLVSG